MDRQQMERCLEQVAAYRASGQKAREWADANGVSVRSIASWCAHSRRWRAKLNGINLPPTTMPEAGGFVAARLVPSAAPLSAHIEFTAGSIRLDLHWPVTHARELAALLQELGR
ncbi:MAG: hypothetical protein KGL43_28745 [Burkholderiales bacterium]|nr:hypothetical protein [Burkholderiales bacterium]MDE2457599.1 hypothetical protein [Burkholderiales bacterium]